jgi:hypothetical protein
MQTPPDYPSDKSAKANPLENKPLGQNPLGEKPSGKEPPGTRLAEEKPPIKTSVTADLEDRIYSQIDQLVSLCSMQAIVDSNDCELPLGLRTSYSAVVEENALKLRKLLDEVFE